EILPLQKRACFLSSSSDFSALPQVFKIKESSYKTYLERHEEQIETILNHLDELPLERIENMEDKIKGLGNGRVIIQRDCDQLETELQEAHTQISGFQKEKIRHEDKIILARVVTMALLPPGFLKILYPDIMDMINDQDIEHTISPTPPPDYPLMSCLGGRVNVDRMSPKRTSTSAAPAMTQAVIRKTSCCSVCHRSRSYKPLPSAQMLTITNRETRQSGLCSQNVSYKEFISCQPFNFKVEGSFNLNSTTGDEKDEVQEVRPSRPWARTKQRGKGMRGYRRHLQQLALIWNRRPNEKDGAGTQDCRVKNLSNGSSSRLGKGIRVYKFNLDYMASIKWVVELPFNVCLLSSTRHLTQEEAAKEELAKRISKKFSLLEELRPVLETMAYHDKYKKVLDEIWKDKVELDGMIVKEEEEAIKKVKSEVLKEKDDPRAFIFPIRLEGQVNKNALVDTGSDINTMPYRIYEKLGREEMKKVDRGITMINHTQAEAIGILTNVLFGRGLLRTIGGIVNTPKRLFSTFDGFCHQTFCAERYDVMRNAKSDSDDEEEYEIKRNKFGAPIYGLKPAPYLNCNDPVERSLVLQAEGCNRDAKSRYNTRLTNLLPKHIYSSCVVNWDILNGMGCDEEINDMLRIKLQLCHEFYSTYEFDEVCIDDELQTKKIIKFRLGGRAHNLTLLEFARRLGLYHVDELEEDGFDVYFQRGLRSDEHFNAQEYWLSISREENLGLSRSHTSTIWNPILRVIHKMITYGFCQRTTGYDKVQKNDLWFLSMFDARHQNEYANVAWLIARWMKIKGADLDTAMLRKLIYSKGRLIPEDPQPGVPRVGIPIPTRASMQDLYERMVSMEIHQQAIERMEYRQSYHWDRY
ncbi:hypothetical protein Tco_0893479, partial [Tanacetum coccineum]